jgi:hypothetical protein
MLRLVFAFACITTMIGNPALASDKEDVISRVQQIVEAYNKNDPAAVTAHLMPSFVIIDDLAPNLFQGRNVVSDWGKANADDSAKNGITDPWMKLSKATYVNVSATHTYVVFPAVYSFKQSSKLSRQKCVITAVLEKVDQDWRIAAWAWTRL